MLDQDTSAQRVDTKGTSKGCCTCDLCGGGERLIDFVSFGSFNAVFYSFSWGFCWLFFCFFCFFFFLRFVNRYIFVFYLVVVAVAVVTVVAVVN